MECNVTNIQWDTDGEPFENLGLSTEMTVDVPDDITDVEDYICDELSNRTGFCHFGFSMN